MSAVAPSGRTRRLLTHSALWLTVAAFLLSLLVWFAAPLIAFGDAHPMADVSARLVAVLAIVLVWALTVLVLGGRRAEKDRRLVEALRRQEAEAQAASAQDRSIVATRIAALRRKAEETLSRLGRASGSRFLQPRAYRLPWYLVIGPSGSGKSTFLLNSGLSLPFGPPRQDGRPADDCDFVFAENAVFLDASGGLFGPATRSATARQVWLRFLDLVRRYRRQQPVCGIFLVLDAVALADMNEEERRIFAKELRRRLDEAGEQLRARPPIYLVLSKIDRLVGFSAFFEKLPREEREQIWGLPFLQTEAELEFAAHERFERGFADLVKRLGRFQIDRLQEEPDTGQRTLVYEFPDHFAALKPVLDPVVQNIAAPHRFDRPPFLRGIFFVSAAQDGRPVDLVGAGAAGLFGQAKGLARLEAPVSRHSRSYFAAGLLRDIALPEAARSGLSGTARRFLRSWQAGGAIVLAGLLLIAATGWLDHYRATSRHATEAEAKADRVSELLSSSRFGPRLPLFLEVLPVLDALRSLEEAKADGKAGGRIDAEADRAYAAGLERLFVPYIMEGLRVGLDDVQTPAAELFQELKLYLALGGTRPLASVDLDPVGRTLVASWLGAYTEDQRRSFMAHLTALSDHPIPLQANDPALVEASRRRIAEYTLAQLAFDLVRARPDIAALPLWRPSDHAGASGPLVIALADGGSLWDGLPGLFTRDPFRSTVLPALRETAEAIERDGWVLGTMRPQAADDTFAGVLNLFGAEYIRTWDTFLSNLTVVPLANAGEGARALSILTSLPSPALDLLSAIAAETDLSPPAAAEAATAGGAALVARGSAALGRPVLLGKAPDPGAAITAAFAPLRRAVEAGEGQASQAAGTLAAFQPLYRQLNHIATGGNILELGAEPQAVAAQISTAIDPLPASMKPFFNRLAESTISLVDGVSGQRIKDIWTSTVWQSCMLATEKRFPFVPNAVDDTPFDDFKAVFAPNGQIAVFRDTYLKPLIDMSSRPWKWRNDRPADLGLSQAALADFEHADAISQAFFPGGDGPATRFTAAFTDLDPKVQVARFDIGDATLRYAHGPVVPFSGQWPPARLNAPAVLTMTPEIDGARNMLVGEGPWALFRLVDQASSRRVVDGNAILAVYALSGRRASIKLTPASARNPFELKLLDSFRCPEL